MNDNIKALLGYLTNYKSNLIIVFCSLFIVAVALLGVGTVFRHLVDNGLAGDLSSINNSIFLISLLIGVFAVGSFFRSYSINLVTEKIIAKIRLDSYKKLLHLEIAAFEELKIGDIIESYITPIKEFENKDEFLNPFMHGFFCGDGSYYNNYPIIY